MEIILLGYQNLARPKMASSLIKCKIYIDPVTYYCWSLSLKKKFLHLR